MERILADVKVKVGVIDANPSSTAGVIDILTTLNQYIPRLTDDHLITPPTHTNCAAVERMLDAQRARAADLTALKCLEGFEPVPQEFHHRGLMMQAMSFCTQRQRTSYNVSQ